MTLATFGAPEASAHHGPSCDRCGVSAEIRACRIERPKKHRGLRPDMLLCLPCIGALEGMGVGVHVRLSRHELRSQMRVLDAPPEPEPVQTRLSGRDIKRTAFMVIDIAEQAIGLAVGQQNVARNARAAQLLCVALEKHLDKVERASKAAIATERAIAREEDRKSAARKALADELRGAKRKLATMRRQVTVAQRELELARQRTVVADAHNGARPYPEIPAGWLKPSETGEGLPEAPGIYFLWNGDVVEYVGQSTKLCNRVRAGAHERVARHHLISFVPVERRLLDWAECWYIGMLQPKLNFGSRASHQQCESRS